MSAQASSADKQISDTLAKYGEPFAGNVWRVQGNAVIYHKALERIAAQADIRYDKPTILRAERDEAVILVSGTMGERSEWSIGEALVDVNYRVSGRQAAYVYAMAEKRGKDRVILKLINLHGLVYSEEEADEFKEEIRDQRNQQRQQDQARDLRREPNMTIEPGANEVKALETKIGSKKTVEAVTGFMLEPSTQEALGKLSDALRERVRAYAKDRLIHLGWKPAGRSTEAPKTDGPAAKEPPIKMTVGELFGSLEMRIEASETLDEIDSVWAEAERCEQLFDADMWRELNQIRESQRNTIREHTGEIENTPLGAG